MTAGRRLLLRKWDALTALGLAAIVLAFARDALCLPALASKEAVQLLTVLLEVLPSLIVLIKTTSVPRRNCAGADTSGACSRQRKRQTWKRLSRTRAGRS